MKTMLLILLALFTSCAGLTAQEQKQADSKPAKAGGQQAQQSTTKSSPRPELQDAITTAPAKPALLEDAGPASLEDATRKAAHDLAASGQNASQAKKDEPADDVKTAEKGNAAAAPSEVGEFHAAPAGASRTSASPVLQKDGSPGKRLHGEVYGASGRAGRAGSEAVGATSKGGKTSVYVQSDQVSTTQPH